MTHDYRAEHPERQYVLFRTDGDPWQWMLTMFDRVPTRPDWPRVGWVITRISGKAEPSATADSPRDLSCLEPGSFTAPDATGFSRWSEYDDG